MTYAIGALEIAQRERREVAGDRVEVGPCGREIGRDSLQPLAEGRQRVVRHRQLGEGERQQRVDVEPGVARPGTAHAQFELALQHLAAHQQPVDLLRARPRGDVHGAEARALRLERLEPARDRRVVVDVTAGGGRRRGGALELAVQRDQVGVTAVARGRAGRQGSGREYECAEQAEQEPGRVRAWRHMSCPGQDSI